MRSLLGSTAGGAMDAGATDEPGLTHYTICSSPLLAAATVSFLDEQAR